VTPPLPIILASASPRRAEILRLLALEFQVIPPSVSEDLLPGESPEAHAVRLSRAKAMEVWGRRRGALVLAGDTVVVLGREMLGKPGDSAEALRMLRALSGQTHTVCSGLALVVPSGEVFTGSLSTQVSFRRFDEKFARAYVGTGEPLDKAGAYGIQGLGSVLIREIRGDYTTVVGFPVPLFLDLLLGAGLRYEFGGLVPVQREAGR
jgi:septum formation protein